MGGIFAAISTNARQRKGTAHAVLGYMVASLLLVQVLGGAILRSYSNDRPMWIRKAHRFSGIAILIGLNVLYLGATVGDEGALASYNQNVNAYKASGWTFLVASIIVTAKAAVWFQSSPKTTDTALL